MSSKIVFSFFDRSANMVRPWAEAGYECYCFDIQHFHGVREVEKNINTVGIDLLNDEEIMRRVFGIGHPAICFFFPPCTHLANSGARWFKDKGLDKLIEGLSLVSQSIKIAEHFCAPYFIENPQGQLSTYWRKPDHKFDPCDYGDNYTKKTHLWTGNGFIMPEKNRVEPTEGSKMHLIAPCPERANLRSVTPRGFAKAVFEANK